MVRWHAEEEAERSRLRHAMENDNRGGKGEAGARGGVIQYLVSCKAAVVCPCAETAADQSKKETADRVARFQFDYRYL